MITTYSVYFLCIILLLWGGKFAGFKSARFHDDSFSLEKTKALKGFAAIGVIMHHVSLEQAFQNVNGRGNLGELSLFVNAGYLFVAIFFFCSGFGLIKSLNTKKDYFETFLKKRLVKTLVIPFYINVLIYALFHLLHKDHYAPLHWVCNFLGLSMMSEYAWYPITAGILYLAFYLIFKKIKNEKLSYSLMALVIISLGMIFCINGHFAWWAGEKNWWLSSDSPVRQKWWTGHNIFWFSGEWWVNSAPAFLAGMLFARFEKELSFWLKKKYWLKLTAALVIMILTRLLTDYALARFGYWTEFSGRGEGCVNKIVSYFSQIPQVIWLNFLIYMIMMKYTVSNPVSSFFGKYSFETYMMNLIPITSFRFLLYKASANASPYMRDAFYWKGRLNLALYFAAIFAASIILGLAYKKICKIVNAFFDRKSSRKKSDSDLISFKAAGV